MDIGNIQLTDKDIQAGNINIPVIKGAPGKAGYTPVKGKDYWTTQDKEEIIQEVNQEFNNKLEEKADKAEVETQLDAKVDKEEGKGLSEENFTKEDKQKLEIIVPETTKSLQGTFFHIPDSAEAPMKISPRGNMEQETREGYNLLDVSKAYQVTKSGVTLTVDKEKQEITLNGNCTADNTTFALNMPLECKAGDYTKGFKFVGGSITIPSGKTSTINLQDSNWVGFVTNLANNDVFTNQTISSDLSIGYTVIRCDSGCVYNNYKIKPFLANGSNKSYEQYGVMPSLDFPSPVKHVGGSFESYNEFDEVFRQGNAIDSTVTNRLFSTQIKQIKAGETYTIVTSLDFSNYKYSPALFTNMPVTSWDDIAQEIGWITTKSYTFTATTDGYFAIAIAKSNLTDDLTLEDIKDYYFMLVEGTSSKPYLPYGEVGSVYDNYISDNFFDNVFRQGGYNNAAVNMAKRVFSQNQFTVKAGQEYTVLTNLDLSIYQYVIGLSQTEFPVNTLVSDSGWLSSNEYKFTPNSDTYFGIGIRRKDEGAITPNDFENVWFLVVTKQKKYSLDLTSLPLYSKNDYIYKSGDKWFVHNFADKYIFTGNETYLKSSVSDDEHFCGCLSSSISKFKSSNNKNYGASNMFKYGLYSTSNLEECLSWGTQMHIKILASRLSSNTAEGLQEFLKGLYDNGTPLYAICELLTPTETEITDKTVIAVLEELYNTYAYDEVTNISVDNPVLSAELVLDVLYYQKTALGLETKVSYEEYAKLLKRVEELENVILTLGGTI